MGVTVHYRGELKSADLLPTVLEELEAICRETGWDFDPFSAEELDAAGASLQLHPEAESLDFYFDHNGRLVNIAGLILREKAGKLPPEYPEEMLYVCSCKTQFAGPLVHKMVVELLLYLRKKYFREMEIEDEGGYYPDRDEAELLRRMQFLDSMIGAFGQMLKTGEVPPDLPEEHKTMLQKSFAEFEKFMKFLGNNPYLKKTN